MVNNEQTWNKFNDNFYDYGFLKFAENWNIQRFAYTSILWRLYGIK